MSSITTEEASSSSDEAAEKTDPVEKGHGAQLTDSSARAMRNPPTSESVPSSNVTKASKAAFSESQAFLEGDTSRSIDERATMKRHACFIHRVPSARKQSGKGSRRRNQGHSETRRKKDKIETKRSLRKESLSQDVRSSGERVPEGFDEALVKTHPLQNGAGAQRTDSPARATRNAPTPKSVPSSNETKASNVAFSESHVFSEDDVSLSTDERATTKRHACFIHHVPSARKQAGKGSRRRKQGHVETNGENDKLEAKRSLREESPSQDNVRSSEERILDVLPLPRGQDIGREVPPLNESNESAPTASEVGGSSKDERRDQSPPTEGLPNVSISGTSVSTASQEPTAPLESTDKAGTKRYLLPRKEESTSSRGSGSQLPDQSSRPLAAAARTKHQPYVFPRVGTIETTRRLSQSNPPESSVGWEDSRAKKTSEAGLETQHALESSGGSSSRSGRARQAKSGTPSMASTQELPFAVTRSCSHTNMVIGDIPTTVTNELDAREEKGRSDLVSSSKAAMIGRHKNEPFVLFSSGKEPSTMKSRPVGDEIRLPAKTLKSTAVPKPAATEKETHSEAQNRKQISKMKTASADVSKLESAQKVTSLSAEKSDRSNLSAASKRRKTDANIVRREEHTRAAGREVREVENLSKVADSQEGTSAKTVRVETPVRQPTRAECKPTAAKETNEKRGTQKGTAVEGVPKETPVQKPDTDGNEVGRPSSDPFLVSVHERADATKRERDMGDVLISGRTRRTADVAVNKQQPSIEKSPLGWRSSPPSYFRSAGSHKSATISTQIDMARDVNLAVREEAPYRLAYANNPACTERFLYVVAICLTGILMVFLLILFWPPKPSSGITEHALTESYQNKTSCKSVDCIRNGVYLSNLLSWRDVDPCSDFYAFVCRRWTSQFTTVFNDAFISTDDDYVALLEDSIYAMLRNNSGDSNLMRPLKDLHYKCMNARLIEDQGWNALLELMSNASLDGFPLTPPVRNSISVWSTAANLLRKTGTAALLSVGVASNPASAKNDVISVGPPELLTTTGSVSTNEAIRLYTSAVFSAVKSLRKDFVPPADILSIVKLASDLEETGRSRVNPDSSKASVLDSPSNLLEFLTAVFQGRARSIFAGARSVIVIRSPNLVNDVIRVVARTEPHTVMNYLGVRLVTQIAPFIPHTAATDFYVTLLYGKRRNTLSRWQLCLRAAEKALQPLIHNAILHDFMFKAHIPHFTDIVSRIISEFNLKIVGSPLFEDVSRTDMQRAISASAVNIIGPKWVNDTATIAEYVIDLPSSRAEQHALETYIAYYQYTFFDSLARGSQMRWSRSAFSANCWSEMYPRTTYVPVLSFNVTQASGAASDDYVQHSRISPRLGRCLFDALLLEEYDSADGANSWLTARTKAKLAEAEFCLEEGERRTGLGRLRDMLAARVAFGLFEQSGTVQKRLVAPFQNGHEMSNAEVFFVFTMLQLCEKTASLDQTRPDAADDWITALRNSGNFSRAYNCAAGAAMNTRQRCIT